jgi:hypothetical protein
MPWVQEPTASRMTLFQKAGTSHEHVRNNPVDFVD